MAIRTHSRTIPSNLIHLVFIAAAATAIAISAQLLDRSSGSDSAAPTWTLLPSFAWPERTEAERFRDEMRMHEALTEAQFGPLASARGSEVAAALAGHEPLLAPDTASEIAAAIAQHDALIEPFVS